MNSSPDFEMAAKNRLQNASLTTYLAQFATLYIFNINPRKLRNIFATFPTATCDFLLNVTRSIRRLLAGHLRMSSRRADLLSKTANAVYCTILRSRSNSCSKQWIVSLRGQRFQRFHISLRPYTLARLQRKLVDLLFIHNECSIKFRNAIKFVFLVR